MTWTTGAKFHCQSVREERSSGAECRMSKHLQKLAKMLTRWDKETQFRFIDSTTQSLLGLFRSDARDSIAENRRFLKSQRPGERQIEAKEAQVHVAVRATTTTTTESSTHPSHYIVTWLCVCECVCNHPLLDLGEGKPIKSFFFWRNPVWTRVRFIWSFFKLCKNLFIVRFCLVRIIIIDLVIDRLSLRNWWRYSAFVRRILFNRVEKAQGVMTGSF